MAETFRLGRAVLWPRCESVGVCMTVPEILIAGCIYLGLGRMITLQSRKIRRLRHELENTSSDLRYTAEDFSATHYKLQAEKAEHKADVEKAQRRYAALAAKFDTLLDALYQAPLERCRTKRERRLAQVLFHIDGQLHGEP